MCVWIIKASRNINTDRRIGDLNNRRSAAARVKPSLEIRPAFAPTQLQYIFRRFLDETLVLESPTAAKCEILYEHSNYFDASKWTVKGEICGAGGIKYSGLERAQGEVMTYE